MDHFFFMRERQQASLTRRQLLLGTAVIALSVSAGFRVPPQDGISSFVIVNGWVLKAADVRFR